MKNRDRREEVVRVARNLFARYGLEKTTIEDIAKKIKVRKGAIYYYFKKKEDIFAVVIKREVQILEDLILNVLKEGKTTQEKLKLFAKTRMRYVKEKTDEFVSIREEYLVHYAFIESQRQDYLKWEIDTIKKILKEGVSRGEIIDINTGLVAESIAFAIKGVEYTWTTRLSASKITKNIDTLISLLFRGMTA